MALIYRWPMQDSAASRAIVETVASANAETKTTNTSSMTIAGPGGAYPSSLHVNGNLDRSIQTPILSISGTPRLSLAFWINSSSIAATQLIAELSGNFATNNGFGTAYETGGGGQLSAAVRKTGFNGKFYSPAPAINQWWHFCYLFDLSEPGGAPAKESKLLVNGVEPSIANDTSLVGDNAGNFLNQRLFLGARSQSSLPAFISLAGVHLYDHILTAGEIASLIAEINPATSRRRRSRSGGGVL
jgi:hypothetical protein